MDFQTLSHAGLRVSARGQELICDPWLVGSAYWRSWWNYPPVPRELVRTLKPTAIYLTHIHWHHFHGPSLRLFDPQTPVIVPFDRYDRTVRDLRAIGMQNVIELKHGASHQLAPGFRITAYHFAPFVMDSALVVEADGVTLLNANDAKLAGPPLNHLLARHPKIDFAFRSHSSANARANFHYLDAPDEATDDTTHYLRSFSLFMDRVRPKWAVPFASNNCLLHDDVFEMNRLVQTPTAVRDYFARFARERGLATQLQIMVPGDRWSSEGGFHLQQHDWFERRDEHLAAYRGRVAPTLAKQTALEARVRVPLSAVERFFSRLAANLPSMLKAPLGDSEVLLVSRSARAVDGFAVKLNSGAVRAIDAGEFDSFGMRIEFPALILLQSLKLNMFGHAAISKRVHYYALRAEMPKLMRFAGALDWSEAEMLPVASIFSRRTIRALLPRWREGLLYGRVLLELRRGRSFIEIEEALLDRNPRPALAA